MAGNMVIPYKWDFAEFFMQGLATVRNDNGKCGYIDKEAGDIVAMKYEESASYFGAMEKSSHVLVHGIYFEINLKGNIMLIWCVRIKLNYKETSFTNNTYGNYSTWYSNPSSTKYLF